MIAACPSLNSRRANRFLCRLAPVLVLIATSAARGEDAALPEDVQKIIDVGRNSNQVMSHLDYLTNRIGPRLTSSDGLTNACEWARVTFEEFGLSNSHLDKWADWPVGFNRGPRFGQMTAPEVLALEFATDSWTAGTKGKQRGPVILAPKNDEELTAIKGMLGGKWVLAGLAPGGGGGGRRGGERGAGGERGGRRGQAAAADAPRTDRPANETQPGAAQPAATEPGANQPAATQTPAAAQAAANQPAEGQQASAQPREGQPREGQPGEGQAGERGGRRGRGGRGGLSPFQQKLQNTYDEVGVLGVITRTSAELIVTGGRRPTSVEFFDKMPNVPRIKMSADSYNAVARHVTDGQNVTLEFDIRNYFKKGPIPIYNVVADVPGSELPDEYVIVGGHLDSWDAATGTTDNGTGCATTMEAARILMAAGVKPKRTIRFMLWTGEEQGLLGSEAYVRNNPELMKKVAAVFVHDAGTQFISGISGLPTQMDDLKQVFTPVVGLDADFPFEVRVTEALRTGGSDHSPFIRAGVSGFFWSQSGDLARYRDTHHTQFDTYDRAVPAYQKHSSIVVALAAYGVANMDHMLARPEPGAAGGREGRGGRRGNQGDGGN
jgi:hypothetical protein